MAHFSGKAKEFLIGIGDIHGRHDALESLLGALGKKYGILKHGRIINARMVFLGDYIDRGQESLKVIQRVDELKLANPESVVTLIGNHELMALQNYEAAKEIWLNRHSLVPAEADADRPEELAKDELSLFSKYGQTFHGERGGVALIKEFSKDEEDAFRKYLAAIAPGGFLSNWIGRLEPLFFTEHLTKKILFSQADIPGGLKGIDEIVKFYQAARKGIFPKQMSGYFDNQNNMKLTKEYASEFADALEVDYLVTAHTTQDEIKLFGGRIFRLDGGMYHCAEPKALVFKPGGAYAFGVVSGEKTLIQYT